MEPAFLFHVPFGLPGISVGWCPNEAQDGYAKAVSLGRFVWRTFVIMSRHGCVIIMMDVIKMTIESR